MRVVVGEVHARFQVLNCVFLGDVDAAVLVLVFERALRVDAGQQWVLGRALRPHFSMVDVDLVIIIWLRRILVVLPELHQIRIHLVWPALRDVVVVLVHFRLLRLVQGVEVPDVAAVRLRDVLVRAEVFHWAACVMRRSLVVVFGEILVVCLALSLGVVLVWLAETVFVVFAED